MRRTQAGFTLLELLISLVILAGVIMGAASLADKYTSNLRASAAAQHMSTVGQAAQAYIKDNYAAVSAVATASTPALIRVSTLSGAGYLSSGFSASNNYAQNVCVLVLQPSAGQLNAMVVAEGGTVIDDLTLGGIAGAIGAASGGVYSSAATTFTGTMDGWSLAVGNFANANASGLHCDGTAGAVVIAAGHPVMALWFAGGDVTSGFLYRNSVPGHPELNQMNTPLVMTSVQTTGGACTTTGAIAQDGSGAVLSCQSGAWKTQGSAYWQDPVANFSSLPACGPSIAWQTRIVTSPTRVFSSSVPRAYTCTGTQWMPLALDDQGNLEVGTLFAHGNLTVSGTSTVLGNESVSGTATINALGGNLQVTAPAAEGAACSGEGRIASSTTTSGLILSCQSGVWKKAGGSGGLIPLSSRSVFYNQATNYYGTAMGLLGYFSIDGAGNLYRTVNGFGTFLLCNIATTGSCYSAVGFPGGAGPETITPTSVGVRDQILCPGPGSVAGDAIVPWSGSGSPAYPAQYFLYAC